MTAPAAPALCSLPAECARTCAPHPHPVSPRPPFPQTLFLWWSVTDAVTTKTIEMQIWYVLTLSPSQSSQCQDGEGSLVGPLCHQQPPGPRFGRIPRFGGCLDRLHGVACAHTSLVARAPVECRPSHLLGELGVFEVQDVGALGQGWV